VTFAYAVRSNHQAQINFYDGPNGTGNLLQVDNSFTAYSCSQSGIPFCDWRKKTSYTNGIARSIKVYARDKRLMLDDMVFALGDITVASRTLPPRNCPATYRKGNPIEPLTGNKTQTINLGVWLGGIALTLNYDSSRAILPSDTAGRLPGFGGGWTASWLRSVVNLTSTPGGIQAPFGAFRPDGREETFIHPRPGMSSAWQALSGDSDYVHVLDSQNLNFYAVHDGLIESNASAGGAWHPSKFASIAGAWLGVITSGAANPLVLSGSQVSGLPLQLHDNFGRKVDLQYQVIPARGDPYADAKVVRMTLPDGGSIQFGYSDNGNLVSITWPDGSITGLTYKDVASPLWTGVIDEMGIRFSTFTYDDSGRAISTEHAGGVNAYSVNYDAPPELTPSLYYDTNLERWIGQFHLTVPSGVVVKAPDGSATQVNASQVADYTVPTSFSQPGGSGCGPSTRTQGFDDKGNLAWQEDFKSNRACYANDQTRNLETSRVEGLVSGSSCAGVLTANSALPANARKVSTSWHPLWRERVLVAQPRRRITYVYNGQPDPFSNGGVVSCAPSTATLPDGSPIVVLCKQVEQATTDANGALGFSATVDTTVPARVRQWTYNQYGQVLTAKDPLNNTTTQTYYSDTTADHTMGDLATVTNALNQVVARYIKYNPAGQWLEMTDANGVTTTRTFDLRQRLKTTTTAGLTTSYDYWPTGSLKSVTLPDTSSVSYGYDDAHRLTSVSDNLGNKITYTLDNNGNRISEAITDPTGRLAKALTRVPDALNRIQQVTGRE
jgi:YD repeat-containing protein